MRSSLALVAAALLLLFPAQGRAQTSTTQPRDDFQVWSENWLIAPLNERTSLVVIGVLRMGSTFPSFIRPVDERAGGGLALKLNNYVTVMPTYLYIAQQPAPTRKNAEHRLILNVTGKFSLGKFNFTDRNLIERRVRHSLGDFVMYRNRLQIDYPVQLGAVQIRVYLADECWYNTALGEWVRNRVSAGVFKQFTPRFYGEIFYLRQHDGLARPGNVHAVGTLVRFTL